MEAQILLKSVSDFKRQAAQGAIHLNENRVPADAKAIVRADDALFGAYYFLRRGKKDYALVRVVDG